MTIAAAALLTLLFVAVPTVAAAATENLLVSVDGSHYAAQNDLPLFPDALRVVPGDRETATVWVRNDSTAAARLWVELVEPTADDPVFASHVSLSATPEGTSGVPVSFATGIANGACTVLSADRILQPGESVAVTVAADVSATLTADDGALAHLGFRLRASLSEALGVVSAPGAACAALPEPPTAPGTPGTAGTSSLPATGGSIPMVAGALGILGVTAGILAFVAGRRRREDDRARDDA